MHSSNPWPHEGNLAFVEGLYVDFLRDPANVSAEWRRYFEAAADPARDSAALHRGQVGPSFRPASLFNPPGAGNGAHRSVGDVAQRQDNVDRLVRAYRVRGHIIAQLDPLGFNRRSHPALEPSYYGFSESDLDRPFSSRTIAGASVRTLREIVELLRSTYCRCIGVQFMHIDDLESRHWLQERMESTQNRIDVPRDRQIRILKHLTDSVTFEEFIQKKFVHAKSFSLEGAESLIPLLDLAIDKAGDDGVQEIVIGMAHRGRLNVLRNIMGKSARQIFREFADVDAEHKIGRGDVKYHLGYQNDWRTAGGHDVHLALCFNPSHLEFVNPVALGRLRAKLDRIGDHAADRGLCIQIHGDAAFAGEGVVQETLNMSELRGYQCGGSLHIIVNNQIGFTTTPQEGRSTPYATDVARMLQCPIFHVNGEDPEAVAQAVTLALDFRKRYKRDVFIDMYCYRRRGHNEGDEPSFTQPIMYRAIGERKSVRFGYFEHLEKLGGVTREEAEKIAQASHDALERELSSLGEPTAPKVRRSFQATLWRNYHGGHDHNVPDVETGVPRERLAHLLDALTRLPDEFHPFPKIVRFLETRKQMSLGEKPLDWAAAEALAFATLATEHHRVRLSGQDCGRGTFSQRHAVLHDVVDGHTHTALQHLTKDQAPVEIINSPLSEAGVLGFEYGYGIAYPDALVMWEAQFGDFVNCAQVIVDQFISSAEDKWESLNGLVLLLPHGFEGQGPEHSSARVERFLQLCAEDNMQVVNPTTPAQYFHVLRRQVCRPYRKPLIVLTPKSLLRHPAAVSSLDDLTHGTFRRIIPDANAKPAQTTRILLCGGKVFFDLEEERRSRKRDDVAIIRLEQFYPLADELLKGVLSHYPDGTPVFWVQEEPANMGAWPYLRARFGDWLYDTYPFGHVSRAASASPATGSPGSHKIEQKHLLEQAFAQSGKPVARGARPAHV
ncbi:2-oxoglutarate dehydrogenase E1 component [Phycisphaerae bacterium RAS1]|nr:2-oxoglutarate dehydrogenase E1 component [Phycisphaerae bacterium RAS1]